MKLSGMKPLTRMLCVAAAGWCGVLRGATPVEEADSFWSEPHTVERVKQSVKSCETALAKGPDAGLLWRAARAEGWLARHAPEKDRRDHAERAVAFGKEAARTAPASPEGYFYYGSNLGVLSRIDSTSRYIDRIERLGKKLIQIDEKYWYAGGRRLLGLLYLNTHSYPFVGAGSLKEAEENLRRACELSPEYGYNQLSHAKALLEQDRKVDARRALEKVVASKPPPGESEDHAQWVTEAKQLRRDNK
jgi:tetratricopeptide (TPR) repeat protein